MVSRVKSAGVISISPFSPNEALTRAASGNIGARAASGSGGRRVAGRRGNRRGLARSSGYGIPCSVPNIAAVPAVRPGRRVTTTVDRFNFAAPAQLPRGGPAALASARLVHEPFPVGPLVVAVTDPAANSGLSKDAPELTFIFNKDVLTIVRGREVVCGPDVPSCLPLGISICSSTALVGVADPLPHA